MEEQAHWYAVKVFYNKVFDMEACLQAYGMDTYVATTLVLLHGRDHMLAAKRLAGADESVYRLKYVSRGPEIYARKPAVNSLLFVKANDAQLQQLVSILENRASGKRKGFIYKDSMKRFAVIPDRQMAMFCLVTSTGADDLKYFSEESMTRYAVGNKVRVLDGPFKGAEGYIKRINKDRRLLVSIEGIIAVASSYIPQYLLEKVEE